MDSPKVQPVHELYSNGQRYLFLFILFLTSVLSFADRLALTVVLEPIKAEFGVSDTFLGLLSGFSFAALYATLGLPVARLADWSNRRTIISAAVVIWSAMTFACGQATSFWQLAVARIGVGAGEAGAMPPAQSLIADYFPPRQRGMALSLFMSSTLVGYLVAFIGGSYIASHYGWREVFIVLGLPGLLLGIVTAVVLPEPRDLEPYRLRRTDQEPLRETLGALFSKRSFVFMVGGVVLNFMFVFAIVAFIPSFMIRTLGVAQETMGPAFGATNGLASLLGAVIGGFLIDASARRAPAWLALVPALALLLSFPCFVLAFMMTELTPFLALIFCGTLLTTVVVPSTLAGVHLVCGSKRRATAIMLLLFFGNMIGMGLGPLVAGVISDYRSAVEGSESLRTALMIMTCVIPPGGWLFWRAAGSIAADTED